MNIKSKIFIGIMTGTSLDGIDIAFCNFRKEGTKYHIEEKFFEIFPYPEKIKDKLRDILNDKISLNDISQMNFALSKIFADVINISIQKSGINRNDIEAIGMHGQTLWHKPFYENFAGIETNSTLQIGSISALNQLTGIPVIGDFRAADIALGGQGAPLVPFFDNEFLSSEKENIVALNIGGIANVTLLPKKSEIENIAAFDTGPGNVLIDIIANKNFNQKYDNNGEFARQGELNSDILYELMSIPYISQQYPKSTGRELFNLQFLEKYTSKIEDPYNLISTLTHFTAKSICINIINSGFKSDKLIVSGGGAKNKFLMELLGEYLKNCEILDSEKIGIGIDSKEALCFAYLAYLHTENRTGNIPNATGARSSAVLGVRAG